MLISSTKLGQLFTAKLIIPQRAIYRRTSFCFEKVLINQFVQSALHAKLVFTFCLSSISLKLPAFYDLFGKQQNKIQQNKNEFQTHTETNHKNFSLENFFCFTEFPRFIKQKTKKNF